MTAGQKKTLEHYVVEGVTLERVPAAMDPGRHLTPDEARRLLLHLALEGGVRQALRSEDLRA